jgi:MoaA/NifB/PqqE/SkfB family radical SAM enzyme
MEAKKEYYIIKGIKGVLKNIFLHRTFRTPLFVHWTLTYRCDSQCKYCGVWKIKNEELDLKSIFLIIEQFAQLGTIAFSLSGGEPLLREDLKDIVDFMVDRKIFVNINSNGTLVPRRIKDLKNVNRIKLSLDGPKEVHDYLRGKGAFEALCKAIDACRENGIKFILNTVISRYNLNYLGYILEFANKLNTGVIFQPATLGLLAMNEEKILTIPDLLSYRKAIDWLIIKKNEKLCSQVILNSETVLRYLSYWPNITRIPCKAGIFFCHIDSDGALYPCNWWRSGLRKDEVHLEAVKEPKFFYKMNPPCCNQCWCDLAEANFLFSFNLETIINVLQNPNFFSRIES